MTKTKYITFKNSPSYEFFKDKYETCTSIVYIGAKNWLVTMQDVQKYYFDFMGEGFKNYKGSYIVEYEINNNRALVDYTLATPEEIEIIEHPNAILQITTARQPPDNKILYVIGFAVNNVDTGLITIDNITSAIK